MGMFFAYESAWFEFGESPNAGFLEWLADMAVLALSLYLLVKLVTWLCGLGQDKQAERFAEKLESKKERWARIHKLDKEWKSLEGVPDDPRKTFEERFNAERRLQEIRKSYDREDVGTPEERDEWRFLDTRRGGDTREPLDDW